MDLATQQEKSLFKVCAALAALVWLVIIFGTFGTALLGLFGAYVFFLFSQSALISYLKGDSIKITPGQFPDLYEKIQRASEKLKMSMPEAYLMNGNGILNAFATKFLSHQYIVLYSDVVDCLEDRQASIDFYIGHELGHLDRKHLRWWPFFMPLYILPLLMPAYRRACELTCDQYGKFCSESNEDAVRALSVLAAGTKRWKSLSSMQFTAQIQETGGFWMSFHELTASYPWLSKRVALIENADAAKHFPKRPLLARLVGILCPGFLSGAFLPLLLIYVGFIGFALVLPSIKKLQGALKGTSSVEQREGDVGQQAWVHPVSGEELSLPSGYKIIAGKNGSLVGSFSINTDTSVERLVMEEVDKALEFSEYIGLLHESKVNLLENKVPMSEPTFRTVNGVKVAEFTFTDVSEGIKFENIVRAWSHDNKRFWHVISTIRADDSSAYQSSEKFLEFLLQL